MSEKVARRGFPEASFEQSGQEGASYLAEGYLADVGKSALEVGGVERAANRPLASVLSHSHNQVM